jgi:hypothetical protein
MTPLPTIVFKPRSLSTKIEISSETITSGKSKRFIFSKIGKQPSLAKICSRKSTFTRPCNLLTTTANVAAPPRAKQPLSKDSSSVSKKTTSQKTPTSKDLDLIIWTVSSGLFFEKGQYPTFSKLFPGTDLPHASNQLGTPWLSKDLFDKLLSSRLRQAKSALKAKGFYIDRLPKDFVVYQTRLINHSIRLEISSRKTIKKEKSAPKSPSIQATLRAPRQSRRQPNSEPTAQETVQYVHSPAGFTLESLSLPDVVSSTIPPAPTGSQVETEPTPPPINDPNSMKFAPLTEISDLRSFASYATRNKDKLFTAGTVRHNAIMQRILASEYFCSFIRVKHSFYSLDFYNHRQRLPTHAELFAAVERQELEFPFSVNNVDASIPRALKVSYTLSDLTDLTDAISGIPLPEPEPIHTRPAQLTRLVNWSTPSHAHIVLKAPGHPDLLLRNCVSFTESSSFENCLELTFDDWFRIEHAIHVDQAQNGFVANLLDRLHVC